MKINSFVLFLRYSVDKIDQGISSTIVESTAASSLWRTSSLPQHFYW